MRHQYTCIFRDVLTSRVWAQPAPTRAVWLWFQLNADPEGFVPATLAGVAVGAHVTVEEARDAIDLLESQDPDAAPDDVHEGRVLMRVPRGFQVLGFEDSRVLAQKEAEKARKRRYMRRYRGASEPQNDHEPATDSEVDAPVSSDPQKVDAPKPKPKPKPSLPKKGEIPPAPRPDFVEGRLTVEQVAVAVSGMPVVTHTLDGWEPSEQLRADAAIAGVTDFDARIAKLRRGAIGGARGVIASEIDNYIRDFFGQWRTWAETDRAKASARAQSATQTGFARGGAPAVVLEPTARHVAFATERGLLSELSRIVADLNEKGVAASLGMGRAKELLEAELVKAAKRKRGEAA